MVLQNVLLNQIDSVIVAPIARQSAFTSPLPKFSVNFNLFETDYVIVTQLMSAIHRNELRRFVTNKEELHCDIISAVYLLFTGF